MDVLVPNEWELSRLAGGMVEAVERAEQHPFERLALLARSLGVPDVVVTMGARGALVVPQAAEPTHLPAPPVLAVDTTGAGDCFCGALCVALSDGAALVDAARFAVAAAALSTTAEGARGVLAQRRRGPRCPRLTEPAAAGSAGQQPPSSSR